MSLRLPRAEREAQKLRKDLGKGGHSFWLLGLSSLAQIERRVINTKNEKTT